MSTSTSVSEYQQPKIIDDLEDYQVIKEKEKNMTMTIVDEKKKSLRVGVIGTGQAGSRLAEAFYKFGYEAVCFNTAPQDLKFIDLPEDHKFHLDYGLGGAAKQLSIGQEAAEAHKESIHALIQNKLENAQFHLLCTSLGGGSGAGSCETMIQILAEMGKPVVVMTVIPMSGDDAQTKRNALETLAKLSRLVQNKTIANLIVVDNAKIESLYAEVGHLDFFTASNRAIVEPLDIFNRLSCKASKVKAIDSTEFGFIFINGGGLCSYGQTLVTNYEDPTAFWEAIQNGLNKGLLSSGFNLKQAKYVGVMLEASKKTWDQIPSANVGFAMTQVQEFCDNPEGAFFGTYETEIKEDGVKVYFMFSGLGLPEPRVEQLKKEVADLESLARNKEAERSVRLTLETNTETTVSQAEKIKQQMATKKSAFGNLFNASVKDKRK